MTRVAILDDYQSVALSMADWQSLGPEVSVHAFNERLCGDDSLAKHLGDFQVIVAMRERTRLPLCLGSQVDRAQDFMDAVGILRLHA